MFMATPITSIGYVTKTPPGGGQAAVGVRFSGATTIRMNFLSEGLSWFRRSMLVSKSSALRIDTAKGLGLFGVSVPSADGGISIGGATLFLVVKITSVHVLESPSL